MSKSPWEREHLSTVTPATSLLAPWQVMLLLVGYKFCHPFFNWLVILKHKCVECKGLFPLVGWKIGDDLTYIAEGLATDTGLCIEWAKSIG